MSYLIAVATSDGEIIDTHFGHADSFLILEVDEDGNYEEIEERDVLSACGGDDCGRCSGSRMNEIADNLKDVDFVLCAKSGPHAEEVLRRYGIAILDVIMPIDRAVPKIHKFRERYRTNVLI